MHQAAALTGDRAADYATLAAQAASLWEPGLPLAGNLANLSALVKQFLDRTNWAGFYLWDPSRGELVLGPFQGLPACTRIGLGKGVCGTAVARRATQLVPDVNAFPGHIACDSASLSEIVVPLVRGDVVLGVLDIDSPELARFDPVDQAGLEAVATVIVERWPPGAGGGASGPVGAA